MTLVLAQPQEIFINPTSVEAKVGDTVKFTIKVQLIHKKCPVPIENTKITISDNLRIIEESDWKQEAYNVYVKTIKVLCIKEGEGYVTVERKCTVYGYDFKATAKVVVKPSNQTVEIPELPQKPQTEYIYGKLSTRSMVFIGVLALAAILALLTKNRVARYGVMVFSLAYFGFYEPCPCPIGSISLLSSSILIEPSFNINILVAFLAPIIVTLIVGRIFCGWICPVGVLQETARALGKLFYKKSIKVPSTLTKVKYAVLVAVIFASAFYSTPVYCRYDPFRLLFNLEVGPLLVGAAAVLLASLFIDRPFCKIICPYGALLSLLNKVSFIKIKRNSRCRNCSLCSKICPMQADPGLRGECIVCLECVQKCAFKALEYKH